MTFCNKLVFTFMMIMAQTAWFPILGIVLNGFAESSVVLKIANKQLA